MHTGYTPASASAASAASATAASASSSTLSRASSSKSLPLAVALGSDSYTLAALSPPRHISSSSSLRSLPGLDIHGPTIPIPSLLSPGQKIEVPLISSASFAADGGASQTRALKAEFHKGVKSFLAEAKANLEELTAELFYEDEAEEEEEEGERREQEAAGTGAGEGQKMLMASTPEKHRGAGSDSASSTSLGPSRITPALLSSASEKQLGSPRKTQLLQQLLSLSAHMDEGLATLASRSSDLAAKSKGPAFETKSHALKFNKNEIQTLAAMTRKASEKKLGSGTPAGNYPDVSEQTKQTVGSRILTQLSWCCAGFIELILSFYALHCCMCVSRRCAPLQLAAFVRRSQLPDRHRAYEQWVSSKEAAQSKALAKAKQQEKEARLAELQAQKKQQQSAERERAARAEEEALRREIEAQRAAEAAEEAARLAEESKERARLDAERLERENARRLEREAELAREKLEAEMAARAAEQRAWEEEKRAKELQENEARRLTEELKMEVARDLALVTQQSQRDQAAAADSDAPTAADLKDAAELDALFAQADRDTKEALGGGGPSRPSVRRTQDDLDSEEEFGEFGDESSSAQPQQPSTARTSAAASARPPLPPGVVAALSGSVSARSGPSATAGRKGRTVARTAAAASASSAYPMPPSFPSAPSLPPSASASSSASSTAATVAKLKAMSFGGGSGPNVAPSTNFRFERAKRMHGR